MTSNNDRSNYCFYGMQEHPNIFAVAIEASSQPFASGYPDGRMMYCNNAFCELTGYSKEELSKMTWAIDLTPPEWRNHAAEILEVLLRTGKPQRYEKEYICKDGSRVPVEFLVHYALNQKGEVEYYYSFITDKTQHKQFEKEREWLLQELTNRHQLLQSILQNVPVQIGLVDGRDFQIKWANNAYLHYLDNAYRANITQYKLDGVIPKFKESGLSEICKAVVASGEAYTEKEYEYTGFDWGPTYWDWSLIPINISGKTLLLLIINEITQQVQSRKRIEELASQEKVDSEEKFRTLFENSMEGVLITKLDGTILSVNSSACHMLGMSEQEICQTGRDGIVDVSDPRLYELLAERKKKGKCIGELNFIAKNGSKVPVEIASQIYRNSKGEEFTSIIIRDISQRIKAQQEMARLDRLDTIGQMAAGIGHEVRNPLTVVRGFLQMLSGKAKYFDDKEYFHLMINELDRANSIISEFLSLAKNKTFELKQVNLNKIVNELYPLISADAIKCDNIVKVELDNIPNPFLDEKEVRQLILNLTRNGLEAMPSGGTLTIKTYLDGEDVILAVRDEGQGISPEVLEKIGTPFLTTKENGTGLGLVTCYSICNRHNAKLDISTGPTGTTFLVKLKIQHD